LLAGALAASPARLKLWVAGGGNGPDFAAWGQTQHPKLVGEVVNRLAAVPGFHLWPKRWVVERTFGWRRHCRRLVRDHEQTAAAAAGWIYLAMLHLMLRRLP
jgi:transposase